MLSFWDGIVLIVCVSIVCGVAGPCIAVRRGGYQPPKGSGETPNPPTTGSGVKRH